MSQAQWNFLWKRMCGVRTAKQKCSNLSTAELNTLWYIGFQLFSFLSYYFLEFDDFIFLFLGDM